MIIALTFLATILFVLIKIAVTKHRKMKYVRHLPAPSEYPIIGSSISFVGKNNQQILEDTLKMCADLSMPFRLWFGQYLVLFVDKPEDCQTILNAETCLDKSFVYRFLQKDVALFTAPANVWRPHRKMLNSTFNFNILNSFLPIFNDKAKLMVTNMEKELGKDQFDVSTYLFACTLDMVCGTTLGYNVGVQSGQNQDYLEGIEKSLTMIAQRIVNVFHHFDFIYKLTNTYKTERKYLDIAESLPDRIIKSKKEEFFATPEKDQDKESDENENFKTPQIFIQQLFKLYKKKLVDDTMIKDQVNLLIFGGNDTSALATSHAILLLAMHPEVQKRAVKELEEVYDDENTDSDFEKLSRLPYLEMIVKEAMRLYPVAPFLSRKCSGDTQITDCVIPEDTVIILSVYHLHRNKEIWGPNADSFDPENFLPERMAKRHSCCYLPFSSGPRNCLGMKYAYLSMKTMLSALLRHYKFSTSLKMEDLQWKFEITMKLVNTHLVRVEKRNFKQSSDKI
ncbi:cytochrome P450 4C1-like isoform X1 [Bradysia coprophila]|uniref:cytochrome P450 4C1-like isoform X1 n=1 Tax=Bradysia coprophila TaxID=38358 RepID=UPI00187D7E62|nr:cytochrome P450 4C1-like isoform X1 [Bradysia coprophila]XP_037041327.1 cytochrome P450 4C1-like isoform X1 [Bradysia coprophila]XP_037041328.1 cytochrome P450 4C1-like isoform X1 [Bradysia coprophila]